MAFNGNSNTNPCCFMTMDSNMALSGNMGQDFTVVSGVPLRL